MCNCKLTNSLFFFLSLDECVWSGNRPWTTFIRSCTVVGWGVAEAVSDLSSAGDAARDRRGSRAHCPLRHPTRRGHPQTPRRHRQGFSLLGTSARPWQPRGRSNHTTGIQNKKKKNYQNQREKKKNALVSNILLTSSV